MLNQFSFSDRLLVELRSRAPNVLSERSLLEGIWLRRTLAGFWTFTTPLPRAKVGRARLPPSLMGKDLLGDGSPEARPPNFFTPSPLSGSLTQDNLPPVVQNRVEKLFDLRVTTAKTGDHLLRPIQILQ